MTADDRETIYEDDSLDTVMLKLAREVRSDSRTDPLILARRALKEFGRTTLYNMAVNDLANWIEHTRREAQRAVEREAARRIQLSDQESAARIQRLGPVHGPEPEPEYQRERRETKSWRFEAAKANHRLADPRISWLRAAFRPAGYRPLTTYAGVGEDPRMRFHQLINDSEIGEFIDFMGDDYQDWYRAACREEERLDGLGAYYASAPLRCLAEEFFVHPDHPQRKGWSAYHAWRRDEVTREFIDMIKDETRLELTQELLSSVFAVGDGSKVSWGDATVAQHQARLSMLTKGIAGTAQTAALHSLAIEMIQASAGAERLSDIAGTDSGEQVAA